MRRHGAAAKIACEKVETQPILGDYYGANGWRVGKNPTLDLEACGQQGELSTKVIRRGHTAIMARASASSNKSNSETSKLLTNGSLMSRR